ncbi:MAG: HigA family addiction module antidote protein [Clostridia bacterium]|nr:HigA family addiction module antidote protein [Clostridia bacterium]
MSNVDRYKEISAFHPGYYIAELIEDAGISQTEFAVRLGTTPKNVSTLVNGQTTLSNDIAKKLSAMTGTGVEVWLNIQMEYDKKKIEIEKAKDFDAQKEIMSVIDYGYFVRYANLPQTVSIPERIHNLCGYLMISDLRILANPDFLVSYRAGRSALLPENMINSRAWLQTAINKSKDIKTAPYNPDKLRSHLPELRSMTVRSPEEFVPRMREIFSQCGVAFVLLPHLKNSGVNGAVKWINGERVVLAMNTRGAYADRFWFTLFHEVRHVFQQKIKTVFISGTSDELDEINASLEEDADRFASDFLIPGAKYAHWSPDRYVSDSEIVAFAESVGIHPGIVAGRLQHDKIIPENRCSGLKEKYTIVV